LLGAADLLGIGVDLRDIHETELFDADEVFISSSIREVLPVVRIEGKAVGGGMPGPLTQRLHEAFRRHVLGAG
jgi:branched-subunit amino acid aminotransferase/4-amino-4-deoxychorismate lyase